MTFHPFIRRMRVLKGKLCSCSKKSERLYVDIRTTAYSNTKQRDHWADRLDGVALLLVIGSNTEQLSSSGFKRIDNVCFSEILPLYRNRAYRHGQLKEQGLYNRTLYAVQKHSRKASLLFFRNVDAGTRLQQYTPK